MKKMVSSLYFSGNLSTRALIVNMHHPAVAAASSQVMFLSKLTPLLTL